MTVRAGAGQADPGQGAGCGRSIPLPANRRDIAVVVDETDPGRRRLWQQLKKAGGNQLVGINLFDVYQGAGMAGGQEESGHYVPCCEDTQRTLEEKEIAETVDNVVRALVKRVECILRD